MSVYAPYKEHHSMRPLPETQLTKEARNVPSRYRCAATSHPFREK